MDFRTINNHLKIFIERNGTLLAQLLLLPVLPLLMWGPATHLYLNKRAIDKLSQKDLKDDDVRKVLGDDELKQIFINAGNSVDLIKANNLRNKERFFEYAHNTIPNYFNGDPVMGRYLLEEVSRTDDSAVRMKMFAWALGWLAHMVSDGFAHKIPHAGCEGWVNSRRVLGGYYSPEKEDESVSVAFARIKLYMADHVLAELIVDTLCYARERDFIDSMPISLEVPSNGEILKASERILAEYESQLGPGYVYFQPLSDEKMKSVQDFYHLLILSSLDVYRAVLKKYPGEEFESYVDASPRMSRLDELLDSSIDAIGAMLCDPSHPWEPDRWTGDSSRDFEHSVYEYERIWRPGRYRFGRKSGLLGLETFGGLACLFFGSFAGDFFFLGAFRCGLSL